LKKLFPVINDFTFSSLPTPRTLTPAVLSEFAVKAGKKSRIIEDPAKAIQKANENTSENEIILITGSHYLGEAVSLNYLT
jgi:folylpolyglutamate synthase/dihydropteroate synthase